MKNCRNCAESDLIDNEQDLFLCCKDNETVSGNNGCSEWRNGKIEYQKVKMFCEKCKLETEHDHEEDTTEDIRTTINVCCVCGNVDLDFDNLDSEFYFDDDYGDLEYPPIDDEEVKEI